VDGKALYHILGMRQGGFMEVTEVRVFPVQEDRLKAYVAITFDHCFVVRDLKIINGNNGLFVAMPSKKRKDGTYRDTAHPLNSQTRQMIESIVLAEYNKEIRKVGNPISNAKI
jgi:stage V sporulation protein G